MTHSLDSDLSFESSETVITAVATFWRKICVNLVSSLTSARQLSKFGYIAVVKLATSLTVLWFAKLPGARQRGLQMVQIWVNQSIFIEKTNPNGLLAGLFYPLKLQWDPDLNVSAHPQMPYLLSSFHTKPLSGKMLPQIIFFYM